MFQVMNWQIVPVAKVSRIQETLGNNYEKLAMLNSKGWHLDSKPINHVNASANGGNDISVYEVDGILVPERDMSKIQVWVKFKASSSMLNPQELAVKVGYIPSDSKYGKHINDLTLVRLRYAVEQHDSKKHIDVEVLGAPEGLTTEDIKGHTLDLKELNF